MEIRKGSPAPLGATPMRDGVNFSIYSHDATAMELLLFDDVNSPEPSACIAFDPRINRSFHYWHIEVAGIGPGQLYGFRAIGPGSRKHGYRFDREKLLLDPYARAVAVPEAYDRQAARGPGPTMFGGMRGVVADRRGFDWEGDRPLERPFTKTIIYETHLRGMTRHPSSGVRKEIRGTYLGLIEKIPYLQGLGVTAVELLPVFHFDAQDAPPGLVNYWGYSPVAFFAPHAGYASGSDPLAPIREFREMVKALHRAGIEIILDVVYNHTAEGDENGPTFSLRGLDNRVYYMLRAEDPSQYSNYSGTGNTLNTNRSVVRRLILDSLRYWVQEMHVDGFRFDLASILTRDEDGTPLSNPPILWEIETDPVLAGTKLIAEAWDAGGLYQVGSFLGERWCEWNGVFRDDVRRFVRGDRGMVRKLGARILASPDLYAHENREPEQSINFVSCHDGFTLNDLVSYSQKNNEQNSEGNSDGMDENFSWNHGCEGPTKDPEIESQRGRQLRNFLALNLLSMGTPMLLMGDEIRRTQGGNNNAYCQDNELSWMDWSLLNRHGDLHRFVSKLCELRLRPENYETPPGKSLNEVLAGAEFKWHGVKLGDPDYSESSHSLALSFRFSPTRIGHLMINAWMENLRFELPPPDGGWRRVIDTSLESPEDIQLEGMLIEDGSYVVRDHSLVLVVAEGAAWV